MEKTSGIYKIEQISNNKVYIGSSKNMYRRCHRHMSELRHGKHQNSFLQRSFAKYGETDFTIECLEKCSIELLAEREQFYINKYNSYNEQNGFNSFKIPYSSKERIFSNETKEKMRKFWNSLEGKTISSERALLLWKDAKYRNFQINERNNRQKNPDYIAKRLKTFNEPKYCEKRSEIAKKIWQNAESREKLMNERASRFENANERKKHSESAKKRFENPSERNAASERTSKRSKKLVKQIGEKVSISLKKKWEEPGFREFMAKKRREAKERKKT